MAGWRTRNYHNIFIAFSHFFSPLLLYLTFSAPSALHFFLSLSPHSSPLCLSPLYSPLLSSFSSLLFPTSCHTTTLPQMRQAGRRMNDQESNIMKQWTVDGGVENDGGWKATVEGVAGWAWSPGQAQSSSSSEEKEAHLEMAMTTTISPCTALPFSATLTASSPLPLCCCCCHLLLLYFLPSFCPSLFTCTACYLPLLLLALPAAAGTAMHCLQHTTHTIYTCLLPAYHMLQRAATATALHLDGVRLGPGPRLAGDPLTAASHPCPPPSLPPSLFSLTASPPPPPPSIHSHVHYLGGWVEFPLHFPLPHWVEGPCWHYLLTALGGAEAAMFW